MALEDSSSSEDEEDDGDYDTVLGMISKMMFGGRGEDHCLTAYTSTVIEQRVMPRS